MDLTLDALTEQRIQREMDRGHYTAPAEVISRALDLLQAEEDWLLRNRDAIDTRLKLSLAQAEQGNSITPDEARRILADRKISRGK